MNQLIFKPNVHMFHTCEEFAGEFQLGKGDLVLSNAYIYEPYFGRLSLPVATIFQEAYGTGEPTDVMVETIMADAKKIDYKRIIAIGGGTVVDIAKVLALKSNGNVDELYGKMPNLERACELVIVPTTCGTGSEVTNLSILNRTRLGTKMGLVSNAMYADSAVLIPELLNNLPLGVFATSSIDALVHAVESSLSPKATAYTKLFGYKAIEMILQAYRRIVAAGNTKESRAAESETMLVASNFAGLAFGTAGCAAVHAMAYPLGAVYHVAHGESNYALFTGVLKNYLEIKNSGEIQAMNEYLAKQLDCSVYVVYDELEKLLNHILPKKQLRAYGVAAEDLTKLTDSVMKTQGRLMANAFVPLDTTRVLKIYSELY